jgi:hypothetical protein
MTDVLYIPCMADSVRAWHPAVPYVREVLHATFEHHSYPAHTHADWTVLLIDDGAVTYRLHRTEHQTSPASITPLDPAAVSTVTGNHAALSSSGATPGAFAR